MRIAIGSLMIIIGIVLMLLAFSMKITVSGDIISSARYYNAGLIADRQFYATLSGIWFISGIILLAVPGKPDVKQEYTENTEHNDMQETQNQAEKEAASSKTFWVLIGAILLLIILAIIAIRPV